MDKTYFDYLDKLMQEANATSQCTISSVLGVRYLERIADHAAYIAEAVVYIATGQKITLRWIRKWLIRTRLKLYSEDPS